LHETVNLAPKKRGGSNPSVSTKQPDAGQVKAQQSYPKDH
jgi:hypothetical protein